MIRGRTEKACAWPTLCIRPAIARVVTRAAVTAATGLAVTMAAAPALAAPHPGGLAAGHSRSASTGLPTSASGMRPGPRWTHIASGGGAHTCAIRANGTLWCWGSNSNGQLGIGNQTDRKLPSQVTTPAAGGWASVATGEADTCAIRTNRTLWCWGDGQNRPRQVTTPAAGGWASVTASFGQTCAIRTNRTLWCWGGGQKPQQVTSPAAGGWASVAPADGFTCATRDGGTLWCWGLNNTGQLGIGNQTNQNLPTQVTTPAAGGWASVATGEAHTCAVRTNHTLWCWGFGDYGQLGIGGEPDVVVLPQQVTTPTPGGWSSVTAGYDHTCATRTNRALWCWGLNGEGQLGLGFFSEGIDGEQGVPSPRQVTTPAEEGWVTVAAGQAHTCAIRGGGSLWCWGRNGTGQLGIGNDISQDQAQRVTGCAQRKSPSSPAHFTATRRPTGPHPAKPTAAPPHATGKPAAGTLQPSIAR